MTRRSNAKPARRVTAAAAAIAAGISMLVTGFGQPAGAATGAAATCAAKHWVGSWEAAPSDAGNPLSPAFLDQTVRDIVTPHLGGTTLRLRLTNRFGNAPVTFSSVYIGRRAHGASLVAGTNTRVTFKGKTSLTIPAHTDVVSDQVRLRFAAFSDLAVSLALPSVVLLPTEHFGARQTSYLSSILSGNHAADRSASAFSQTTPYWSFLDGIDVLAPANVGAVVALGDSITDGWIVGALPVLDDPATRDLNRRYPDELARRLAAQRGGTRLSVLNAGISGNQVLANAPVPFPYGPSALNRLTHDVIDEPGVTDVILMEGTNDLNPLLGLAPGASAAAVISGLSKIVTTLHKHRIRVILGTIPPRGDDQGTTLARRLAINTWIRTSHRADAVVDFAAALADPAHPNKLRPAYDSGDHLHPSIAGYQAMANAINLHQLTAPSCN